MKDNDFTSDYFEYLQFERGLSKNTIVAYQRDLQKFHDVCKKSPIKSGPEEISALLSNMHNTGQSARSQSGCWLIADFTLGTRGKHIKQTQYYYSKILGKTALFRLF